MTNNPLLYVLLTAFSKSFLLMSEIKYYFYSLVEGIEVYELCGKGNYIKLKNVTHEVGRKLL